jgi:hypothetical protein
MLSRGPIKRGLEAGLIASVPQVLLAKAEERALLRRGEDADIGPRFVERLARLAGLRLREDTKWLAASAFHFGYATFWGTAYALAYRRWRPHPLVAARSWAASSTRSRSRTGGAPCSAGPSGRRTGGAGVRSWCWPRLRSASAS